MDLNISLRQSIKPQMSFALKQAIEILELPQLELAQWIREEIEHNPLLEEKNSVGYQFDGNETISQEPSLYESISQQIQESELTEEEQKTALELYSFIDDKGFFHTELKEIADLLHISLEKLQYIVEVLQTFQPPGIFAKNLRESLLLQLKAIGELKSISYQLIDHYFADLLRGRFKLLEKKLGKHSLKQASNLLSRLSLRPASSFSKEPEAVVSPDLKMTYVDEKWMVEVLEEDLPVLEINADYLTLQGESKEERDSLREWTTQAKWLFRSLKRRKKILTDLGLFILKKQNAYLEQKGPLKKIPLREAADELELHLSTLSRAIQGKYISTPQGTFPMRSFFSHSSHFSPVKQALLEIVQNEDKSKPLSDTELVLALQKQGITIARRTISKYRQELKISSQSARKHLL